MGPLFQGAFPQPSRDLPETNQRHHHPTTSYYCSRASENSSSVLGFPPLSPASLAAGACLTALPSSAAPFNAGLLRSLRCIIHNKSVSLAFFNREVEMGCGLLAGNMKLRTKRPEWKSLMPLQLSRKSAMRFFLFPKVQSAVQSPDDTPVYLNVYDLTPMNGYIYWAGLGIFHSGIEVHGVEYAFGAHDYPTSGVFEVEPRQCPGFRFRKSILLGAICNCLLPESLKISPVGHDPNSQSEDSDKRRLRNPI
ncbi:hypothetical protein PR202_gb18909 [Eleusine coracana subsp. coracana]|uniref:PPPDE domain-containing protein n=1 Tax=Eleusine coracana subsp. coracana TaxID=191504 RepID=A0AAV5F4N0_ELECO|nr:hypothetical protein PR202_gb18909 [Eleusine coracana subsp. coracana]